MPCLEPDKNLSKEAKEILLVLGKLKSAERVKIAEETGFVLSLVSRKLRELMDKETVREEKGVYFLTEKGKEAISVLNS